MSLFMSILSKLFDNNKDQTFQLISMFDPESNTNQTSISPYLVTAPNADKAALLFMAQIFENNKSSKVVRILTLGSTKSKKFIHKTVHRSHEPAITVNGTRFQYAHRILKMT